MDGFCAVVNEVLKDYGLKEAEIYLNQKLELPGYFRPTKNWDMLVISRNKLVAAMEFKSQKGPSFGNNFNNRAEEAIGTSHDLWTAYREGAFGLGAAKPWLGWVMLLEDCIGTRKDVSVKEPHFPVFSEFKKASYSKRYELLLLRLMRERLYDSAAFITATEQGGPRGQYSEPLTELSMNAFLAGLAGHVGVHLASRGK